VALGYSAGLGEFGGCEEGITASRDEESDYVAGRF
jgi:hypothetical protein